MKRKTLRYIEISRRNPVTRIMTGSCGDICIEIRRAGQENCFPVVDFCPDNPCQCGPKKTMCDTFVSRVCALEVDSDGYAIFEWPTNLMNITEGWYEGHLISNNCNCCGIVPVRIGPRCNVIEVETEIMGPDGKCWVGCEDECLDTICETKKITSSTGNGANIYIPDYTIYN